MLKINYFDAVGQKMVNNDKQLLLKKADFDFGVIERDLYYIPDLKNGFTRLPNKKVLLRKDTQQVLGVTKDKYSVVTMIEALSLFDQFVEEQQLYYEYAGSSSNKKRESLKFWVLLRLNEEHYEVTKGDYILPYLLVSNSFDGTCGLQIRSTGIRYDCENLTHLLLKDGGNKFYVKHTGESKKRFLNGGKKWLNELLANNQLTISLYQQMNNKKIEENIFRGYLERVFNMEPLRLEEWKYKTLCYDKWLTGDNYANPLTLYSAYNAVTNLLSHELGNKPESRFYNHYWGSSSTYSTKAFNYAVSLLK